MVLGIYTGLSCVVELPWLSRFDTNPGIGIGGAIMRVVAKETLPDQISEFIKLSGFIFSSVLAGVSFLLPPMVIFYFRFFGFSHLFFIILIQLSQVFVCIVDNLFLSNTIQAGIGLD